MQELTPSHKLSLERGPRSHVVDVGREMTQHPRAQLGSGASALVLEAVVNTAGCTVVLLAVEEHLCRLVSIQSGASVGNSTAVGKASTCLQAEGCLSQLTAPTRTMFLSFTATRSYSGAKVWQWEQLSLRRQDQKKTPAEKSASLEPEVENQPRCVRPKNCAGGAIRENGA